MKKEESLRIYLIKRFVVLMIATAACELVINGIYDNLFFPYMKNSLFIDVFAEGEGIVGTIYSLITMLLYLVVEIMIKNKIPMLYTFLDSRGFTHEFFQMSGRYGGELPTMYYVGIIAILIILFLVLMAPYVVTAIVFIKIIISRVDRPIREITDGMAIVGGGNFNVKLDFETEHEFVLMRDTFNIMAENIEESRQKNEEYEKQRSLMFADIAHDLKTPITTIAGYSRAIADGMVTSEDKKKEYLYAIHEKSQRMDELIKMLFEYAKLTDSHYQLHFEKIDVAEIFREIVAGVYTDFEEKGIELDIEIYDGEAFADIDRLQFTRAVMNIVNNSIKHNSPGNTVLAKMTVEDVIEIKIADNGDVIEAELAKHIFEPFTVGDESRNSRNGSGLGLSIAHQVVSMHGGSLTLENCDDGTYTKAFVIRIPYNNKET